MRDDNSAVAASHVFEFIEAIAAANTKVADGFVVVGRAMGLGTVFDDRDVVRCSNFRQSIHVTSIAR